MVEATKEKKNCINGIYKRGKWVCEHCGADVESIHIATGHDHTDSSTFMCFKACNNGIEFSKILEQNRYASNSIEYYIKTFPNLI